MKNDLGQAAQTLQAFVSSVIIPTHSHGGLGKMRRSRAQHAAKVSAVLLPLLYSLLSLLLLALGDP